MKEIDNQQKSKQIRAFGLDWQYVDQHVIIIYFGVSKQNFCRHRTFMLLVKKIQNDDNH